MSTPKKDVSLPEVVYKNLGSSRPSHKKNSRTPFGLWKMGRKGKAGKILCDPRQSEYELLDTLIHETLHEAQPEITEEGIERISRLLSRLLWREGFRKTLPEPPKDE